MCKKPAKSIAQKASTDSARRFGTDRIPKQFPAASQRSDSNRTVVCSTVFDAWSIIGIPIAAAALRVVEAATPATQAQKALRDAVRGRIVLRAKCVIQSHRKEHTLQLLKRNPISAPCEVRHAGDPEAIQWHG